MTRRIADHVAEVEHGALVRHGGDEPAEVLHPSQARDQMRQAIGRDVEWHEHGIRAEARKQGIHRLRRLHMVDRVGENAEDPGLPGDDAGGNGISTLFQLC
jgi:hypothetical protein